MTSQMPWDSGVDLHREFTWGRIRPWRLADAPSVFTYANNRDVGRYMTSESWHAYSLDKHRRGSLTYRIPSHRITASP